MHVQDWEICFVFDNISGLGGIRQNRFGESTITAGRKSPPSFISIRGYPEKCPEVVEMY